jgi:uncharacterized protein YfaS (alpha-2-macroglobulin family)
MKNRGEAERRAEAYLREVERHLAHKPEAVRREVVAGLRDHIAEAMRRAGERGEAGLEAVERILAEMDPPETFAEAAVEVAAGVAAAAAPAPGRLPGGRWFALALAFLAVNTYGVWRWTDYLSRAEAARASEPAAAAEEASPAERVLRLRKVEQVDVSPERELLLRFVFSDRPDRAQMTRHLKLTAPGQGEVDYQLAGTPEEHVMLVQSGPVRTEKLDYVLEAGLPSAGESKPTERAERGSLKMEMNLLLRQMEVESPAFEPLIVRADFTAIPEPNGIREYITVDPAVEFTVETVDRWWWNDLQLRGDFEPGAIYEITFKKGLPAANGSSLPESLTRRVHFPARNKAVRIDSPGRYLAPGGALAVPVLASHLDRYEARLSPVFPNNLVQLALRESGDIRFYGGATDDLTGKGIGLINVLPPPAKGEPVRGTVELRRLAAGEPRGVYWLQTWGEHANGDARLLVVTDLGLAARTFPGVLLAWVNRLGSAGAVENAAVTVYARNNQVIGRGTTDARGLARIDLTEGETPFVVTAEADGDLTYMDLERTRVAPGEGTGGVAYLEPGQIEAAVFTERGIYRPGETVFVQALARDGQMRAPEPFPALLRVRRPDGRIYREFPMELDDFGSASGEIRLPDYLPTGRYGFELAMPGTHTLLGSASVALEDFVPPQIRVAVQPPEGRFAAGDVLAFGVRGEHLFSAPAAGLKVTAAATFAPAPFAPTNWPGWTFGDGEKDFPPVHRKVGSGSLDGEGAAIFQADTRKAWRPPAALKVILAATVTEPSGRAATAYGSAMVDAYPFYVGMKPAWEGAVRAGETQRVAVAQVQPDGEPVAEGKPLVLTLSRVTWNSVLRRNSDGRYEWTSERQVVEIRRDTLAAGGEPRDWAFAVEVPGDYMLTAADPASGAATRLAFCAPSPASAWAAWSRAKPGPVALGWVRDGYHPGDTARLQVRAPFAGRALLTVETAHLREARVVELEKNTAEIEIAVDEAFAPNAWCTLTLIRPAVAEAVWSAHRATGTTALPVERPERRLRVELDAPAAARPQTPLAGRVTVRTDDGSPAAGRVTVMAVDEGICLLTAFSTPDPMAVFTAQRALASGAFDLYSELMPILEEALESTPAPGGDAEGALRKRLNPIQANRFKPVALWRANLPLDAEGRAEFEMDLPEFSGELRLMAVAFNDGQAGSTSMPVVVRRDLVVQPSLPRFLAMGDRAEAVVALNNQSAGAVTAAVRATCGGPLRAETAEQRVELAAGEAVRVPLVLTAGPGPGKALCTLEVEAGEESYRETIELAVRPGAGLRVATGFQKLKPGAAAEIAAPDGWLPESVFVSGALSALPSAQLGRALDYVVHYPYGCLEQTVSGAFPLLHAGEWIERLLPAERAPGDVEALVSQAVSRVLSMQQEDGGFAPWPFLQGTAEEPSVYAVHFLVEAKAAGFAVPEGALESALAWVRGRLDRALTPGLPEDEWRREMQMRAYYAHVLARAGRPDAGWNARLREQVGRLSFAAKAHAAAALVLSGEPRQAVELMEPLGLPVRRDREPGRLFDSDVRDAALLLDAWLEVDPEGPAVARLAQSLRDRQRDGHWGNTQDNAMALLAFGKLARHLPDTEEPFAGMLTLPGGGPTVFGPTNQMTWAAGPGLSGPVAVRNDGPGPLYLWVRHEGVAAEPEASVTNGVSIRREFLNLGGNPVDESALKRGDLLVVRLTVDPQGNRLDQLVIEDLLPAGLEIENPNLATAQLVSWLKQKEERDRIRDVRDDRMLIFTGDLHEPAAFHYAVRAVTAGTYILPPPVVSGMYEPEIRGVGEGGELVVRP